MRRISKFNYSKINYDCVRFSSSWLGDGVKSISKTVGDTVANLDVVTPALTQTMNEMKTVTADMSKKYLTDHDEVTITSSFSVGLVTMTITVKDKKKD